VVVDAEAITNIDYSASRVVMDLAKRLEQSKVTLGFARLPEDMRRDFERHHLSAIIPESMVFDRLHDSLNAFEAFNPSTKRTDSPR